MMLGSWESLWKISEKDINGNTLNGRVLVQDTKDSIISSEDKLVVSIDLENVVIVETKDAVLVANSKSSQVVKNIVSFMNEKGFNEAKNHKVVYRPWGSFLSIEEG